MSKRGTHNDWQERYSDLRANLSNELIGVFITIICGFVLITVLRYAPGSRAPLPWLTAMTGWTAPLVALTGLLLGLVLVFKERLGYWSAESLVGAEIFLLGLQAMTFVIATKTVTWSTRVDGENGGLVGWAIGSLLMSSLGKVMALIVLGVLLLIGIAMLLRYTPLIFPVAYLLRWLTPVFGDMRHLVGGTNEVARPGPTTPVKTPSRSYVPAVPPPARKSNPLTGTAIAPTAPPRPGRRPAAPEIVTAGAPTSLIQPPLPVAVPTQAPPAAPPTPPAAQPKPAKEGKGLVKPPLRPAPLPSLELLKSDAGHYSNVDIERLKGLLVAALEDHQVPVRVVHVETGPTVTQFGVEPLYTERAGIKRKVRVSRIVALQDDLALALAAQSVRIEAPVPGQGYVGIEVPNAVKSLVSMRDILEHSIMRKGGTLTLPLGRDTAGQPVIMDLVKAPHMLIAGSTGSGKSVCINTIIAGLLMQHSPDELRFVMVDPKMVELPGYNGIPHLVGKVITDVNQVMGALTWLLIQMDDRYQLFRGAGVRNIESYNDQVKKNRSAPPLPYIVLIIDELADLMMTAAEDVERQICRLAQMARATGIHLIIATQRPSVDVVTGLIKANFPTRVAFAVTSQIDSRVIIDQPGAERLLGRGDMLLMRPDAAKLFRVQGCFVADDEIARVVGYWKQQVTDQPPTVAPWQGLLDHQEDGDELIEEAIDILRGLRSCSTSMLQRKLRIGYPRAARLMEELTAKGIVGGDLGGGQGREVLLKKKEDDAGGEDHGRAEETLF